MSQKLIECNADFESAKAWLHSCLSRMKSVGKFSEFYHVTPAMARLLLENNPNNRKLVDDAVQEWSATLRIGDWEVNGEPIIIADTGELNDGQHRLTAVIKTGISLPSFVVFGVSRDSRKTVDSGKKRTAAHVFGMSGIQNASSVSASLKIFLNLDTGTFLQTHRTSKELERVYEKHSAIAGSVGYGSRASRPFKQSNALFMALHYQMSRQNQERANFFFDRLADGVGLASKSDPIAKIRAKLLENSTARAKLPITDIAALIIKSWHSFLEGKQTHVLRWSDRGPYAEEFPRIKI